MIRANLPTYFLRHLKPKNSKTLFLKNLMVLFVYLLKKIKMAGINKVILVGHLGKDPELRYLEGNIAKTRFSLATSEYYKDKTGSRIEQTEWHNIVMWRTLAENAE